MSDTYDYTRAFAQDGQKTDISDADYKGGWYNVVGGQNGIPTIQQFNTIMNEMDGKTNNTYAMTVANEEKLKNLQTDLGQSDQNITAHVGTMASSEVAGHTKLCDAIDSTSDATEGVSATPLAVKTAYDKAEEAEAIAKGRNQAHVFSTTAAMQAWLSDVSNKGLYNVGDNLYIVELNVPDWWIAEVLEAADPSTGYYYKIAQLETQKVDLTNIEADIAAVTTTAENALSAANSACKAVTNITASTLAELAHKVTRYPIGSVFRFKDTNNVLGLNVSWITFSAEFQNMYTDEFHSCEITLTITISNDDYSAPIKILIIGNAKNGVSIAATKRLASTDELDAVKKSVSDGKSLVASAITANGVTTAADATFQTMAGNVNNIRSDGTATAQQILKGSTAWVGKNKITGTLTDYGYEPTAAYCAEYSGNLYLRVPDFATNSQAAGRIQRGIKTPLSNLGNATAAQVLSGKKFTSSAGLQVTGAMTDYTGVVCEIKDVRDAPARNRLEVAVPPGYHAWSWAGDSYEYLPYAKLASTIGLSANKIVKGNTVCGIAGNGSTLEVLEEECYLMDGSWSGQTLSNTSWKSFATTASGRSLWSWRHDLGLSLEDVELIVFSISGSSNSLRFSKGTDSYEYMSEFVMAATRSINQFHFNSNKTTISFSHTWNTLPTTSSGNKIAYINVEITQSDIEVLFWPDDRNIPLQVNTANPLFKLCVVTA